MKQQTEGKCGEKKTTREEKIKKAVKIRKKRSLWPQHEGGARGCSGETLPKQEI